MSKSTNSCTFYNLEQPSEHRQIPLADRLHALTLNRGLKEHCNCAQLALGRIAEFERRMRVHDRFSDSPDSAVQMSHTNYLSRVKHQVTTQKTGGWRARDHNLNPQAIVYITW